ncbi:motile sperm domain containing 2 [Willisornis vidua]|uniref:Motile sperm domain containing 2 n=1 Tax=Willisornis vidua TaxID=1566151 RepID=A0ABQ9DA52_9PASS|nr:motile sperm domain containing 2 [Willisornis vidua]
MAEQRQDKAALISETRRRFEAEYLPDKSDKYDPRDVERLQQDDKWVENYLIWRHDVVDDTLKMIDESFQWRKEYTVNDLSESVLPKWLFEIGALFLHGYDKEGYKLFWFKVKHHTREPKQQLDKKKLVAFWLEHYAKRDHGKPLTVVFDMAETGISHIDSFKYSYPPLVDDDFQTPLCENGPITNEDEHESKEEIDAETKETGEVNEAQNLNQKKMNSIEHISKSEETDKTEVKPKNAKKALTTFKGPLLHISPAEELYFGSKETGEKKCLIVLTNVTKNVVAFKVRTTAPEKYRVKPSNSSCEPGTSLDIIVSLHGGFAASLQDRFLIMAAEMDQSSGAGAPELTQFWKDVPRTKVMEHRLRCHVIESSKPSSLTLKDNAFNIPAKTNEDLHMQKKFLFYNGIWDESEHNELVVCNMWCLLMCFCIISKRGSLDSGVVDPRSFVSNFGCSEGGQQDMEWSSPLSLGRCPTIGYRPSLQVGTDVQEYPILGVWITQ